MSLNSIENLSADFPDVFEDRGDPFYGDHIIIDANNPDGALDDDIFSDWPDQTDGIYDSDINWDRIVSELPSGKYPGAPTLGGSSYIPPIDALAFYIPFHYYPKWWGIYLTVEGLFYLSKEIISRSTVFVPTHVARNFAKVFLYRHEFFHHKIESLATRMECITRSICYAKGIEKRYHCDL